MTTPPLLGLTLATCNIAADRFFRLFAKIPWRMTLKFTNAQGVSKFGRYRIVPESGPAYVSDDEAAKRPPTALADNLRASLEKGPVKYATKVCPDSRPTIELGEIAITKALDTKKVENGLLFMPTNLTKGIDVSDDPILNTRTEAYGESYGRRIK